MQLCTCFNVDEVLQLGSVAVVLNFICARRVFIRILILPECLQNTSGFFKRLRCQI